MTCPTHYTIKRAKRFEAGGESLTLTEWARRAGVSAETFRTRVRSRVAAGWTIEDALVKPPANNGGSNGGSKLRTGLKPRRGGGDGD